MKKVKSLKSLLLCLLLPLAGGIGIAFITMNGNDMFDTITKPPFSPPPAAFPIVWTILYLMMGLALYYVWVSAAELPTRQAALRTFTSQLIINYLWPIIFFIIKTYWAAVVCLVLLIILVVMTYIEFRKIEPKSGKLFIPYLIWLAVALYLNIGVAILN